MPREASAHSGGGGDSGEERPLVGDVDVNPFSRLDRKRGPLDKALLALCLVTVAPLRLLVAVVFVVNAGVWATLSTLGKPRDYLVHHPLRGAWRLVVSSTARLASHMTLLALGYIGVEQVGKRDESVNIIVSNHVSYMDIVWLITSCAPSFVSKAAVMNIPAIGRIAKALNCVFITRASTPAAAPTVRSSPADGTPGTPGEGVSSQLRARSSNTQWPPVVFFPDGTTTNGRHLLKFRSGAFVSGLPVQPVVLLGDRDAKFDPSFVGIHGLAHLWVLLASFRTRLRVVWLPVYTPSEEECKDPALYASNVRAAMAEAGDLALSDYTYRDFRRLEVVPPFWDTMRALFQ